MGAFSEGNLKDKTQKFLKISLQTPSLFVTQHLLLIINQCLKLD